MKLLKVKLNDTFTANPLRDEGVGTYNAEQSATENDSLLMQTPNQQNAVIPVSKVPNPQPRKRNPDLNPGNRQADGTILADQTLGADPNSTLSNSFKYN